MTTPEDAQAAFRAGREVFDQGPWPRWLGVLSAAVLLAARRGEITMVANVALAVAPSVA